MASVTFSDNQGVVRWLLLSWGQEEIWIRRRGFPGVPPTHMTMFRNRISQRYCHSTQAEHQASSSSEVKDHSPGETTQRAEVFP